MLMVVMFISPMHSFMLDLDDAKTKALLSGEDWKEIISDLPSYEHYGKGAGEYLDKCMEVASREDMRKILESDRMTPNARSCTVSRNRGILTRSPTQIVVRHTPTYLPVSTKDLVNTSRVLHAKGATHQRRSDSSQTQRPETVMQKGKLATIIIASQTKKAREGIDGSMVSSLPLHFIVD